MFAKGASRFKGLRGFWGSKKHIKTRENRETKTPGGSKTHKNTCLSARSHFGVESARKYRNTQKHVCFGLTDFADSLGPSENTQNHSKSDTFALNTQKHTKTRVFLLFSVFCHPPAPKLAQCAPKDRKVTPK